MTSAEYVNGLTLGSVRAAASSLGITATEWIERRASGTKWCIACRRWQPVGEFRKDRSRPDGLNVLCLMRYRSKP